MKLKKSEARIIIYLRNARPENTFGNAISIKLDMDYAHCRNILSRMVEKEWVVKVLNTNLNKTFYTLVPGKAPVRQSRTLLSGIVEEEEE